MNMKKKVNDPNKSRQGFTYVMHPEANYIASIYMLYVNIRLQNSYIGYSGLLDSSFLDHFVPEPPQTLQKSRAATKLVLLLLHQLLKLPTFLPLLPHHHATKHVLHVHHILLLVCQDAWKGRNSKTEAIKQRVLIVLPDDGKPWGTKTQKYKTIKFEQKLQLIY